MSPHLRPHACRAFTQLRRTVCTPADAAPKLDSQKGVMQFLDSTGGAGAARTGRAWRTSELRLKSSEDLRRLWFILIKERNVLLTEKEWCRSNRRHWVNGASNMYKIRGSMAKVKVVLGERARATRAKAEARLETEAGLGDAVSERADAEGSGVVTRKV